MHDSCRGRHEGYSNSNTPIVFLLKTRVGLSSTLDVSQQLFMTCGSTIIDGQIIIFVIILKREKEIMVDRARLAVMKWIPLSSVGAAISFVVGFILNVPPTQVIISAAMTATLVFSALAMQSYGRAAEEEKERKNV